MLVLLAESEENHVLFLRRRRLVETGDLVVAHGKKVYRCGNCGEEIFRYPSQVVGRVFCKICRRADPIKDFWSKVDKTSSANGCWLWTGRVEDGYGNINWNGFRRAHRLAYFLIKGPIPTDKILLHKCPGKHNRLCVNPDHLKPGDKYENARDSVEQGTNYFAMGEKNANATAEPDAVAIIKRDYIPGKNGNKKELAHRFGYSPDHVYELWKRSWRHVTPAPYDQTPHPV